MTHVTVPVERYGLLHPIDNDVREDALSAEEQTAISAWRAAVAKALYQPVGEPQTKLLREAEINGQRLFPREQWNPMKQRYEEPPHRAWSVVGRVITTVGVPVLPDGFTVAEDLFWVVFP